MSRETKHRLEELKTNRASVAAGLAAAGAGALPDDGLATLAERAKQVIVPKGTLLNGTVSATATIYPGDRVRQAEELWGEAAIRFAASGAAIVACATLRRDTVVAVFAQDRETWIKTAQLVGGGWVLGATVKLVEKDALEVAAMVRLDDDTMAILYNSGAAGMLSVLRFTGLIPTVAYTDLFDEGDPCNIAADALMADTLAVCYTRRDENQAAYLRVLKIGPADLTRGGPAPVTLEGAQLEYSRDEYATAWTLAADYSGTVYVTFPREGEDVGEERRGILTATVEGLTIRPALWKTAALLGGIPAAEAQTSRWTWPAPALILAHGITRTSAGKANKSMLGLEIWFGTETMGNLWPLCWGEEDVTYAVNLGRVCVGEMAGRVMAAYSVENRFRAAVTQINEYRPADAPSVEVCSFSGFAQAVPLNGAYAALIYQTADGAGYFKALRRTSVMLPASGEKCDGIAKTGGEAKTSFQYWKQT